MMMLVTLRIVTLVTLSFGLPQPGHAQQDSTTTMLRSLLRRLDSLERVVADLRASQRDTTQAIDEVAALRTAARAAAGETASNAEGQSRTRNLQILNPEISVTGDVVGSMSAASQESAAFTGTPREFEFSFQAALDPYTRTKVFITREEDFEIAGAPEPEAPAANGSAPVEEARTFEIEEGYMYWVGLPGGLGAKIGKFRQEIGLYNRWHTHALPEVERPLATTTFLGEDGLIQTGASIALPTITLGSVTQSLTFEVARGSNEVLFERGSQMSYLGRLQNFFDISSASYLQLGATGVYGKNSEADLESRLLGLDLAFRWNPGAGSYQDLQLKGEWYFLEQNAGPETLSGNGGYLQANYRLNRQWILGTRADHVNFVDNTPNIFQLVPSLTWWQSEWVRLRLQYNMLRPSGGDANHTVLLQFVWAMGPHKHETY